MTNYPQKYMPLTSRPSNWNWVKATHECTASVMFGTLHALARHNVETRNEQLGGRHKFAASEDAGTEFCVGKNGIPDQSMGICFALLDWKMIRVTYQGLETTYTVRLDSEGSCKLWCEDQSFEPWQVLKKALEPLLFSA